MTKSGSRPSVALRLALVLTLLLIITAILAVGAAYSYGRTAADTAFDRLLTGAALQISERISVVDGKTIVDLPTSAFKLMSLAPDDRVFYRVVGADGKTLTGYDDLPPPSRPKLVGGQMIYESFYSGSPVRAVILQRYLVEQDIRGPTSVIVAHTELARASLALDIALRAMFGVAFASIVIIAFAFLATRYALRPLQKIETAILARDPLDLSPFEEQAPREVDALVEAINRFMGRLDSRVRGMQDFVSDTAHQMRTPITAMRLQAELALDEQDPGRIRAILQRIRGRAVGVSRLMEQLLSQALIIHRSDTAPLLPLDARRIAVETEREYRTLALVPGDAIDLDLPPEEMPVNGDAFSLREALKNLIANAFAHGAPPIAITVEPDGDSFCLLKVHDQGPGIAPDTLADMGMRFSRNPQKPESAGLGLAIVRRVAMLHGGELVSGHNGKGGFWIGLRLPLAKQDTNP